MNSNPPEIRSLNVTRYVTPLREGGSLPAIVEADDGFLYVLKFRGAGQGSNALVAELLGGEIARLLGLKVPEIVFANLEEFKSKLTKDRIENIVSLIPDAWIGDSSPFSSKDLHRKAYVEYFESRVLNSNLFVKEALDARDTLI